MVMFFFYDIIPCFVFLLCYSFTLSLARIYIYRVWTKQCRENVLISVSFDNIYNGSGSQPCSLFKRHPIQLNQEIPVPSVC